MSTLTLTGQAECGDLHVVAPFRDGVLVAVVDGVGHGHEAAEAAKIATGILKRCPQEPVSFLLKYCHEGLRETRGVVMSLASFNTRQGTMTWAGVGNVEGRLLSKGSTRDNSRTLLLSAGILGHRLTPLSPAVVPVHSGDTLILATDGARENFCRGLNLNQPPQIISDYILARDARRTDDALVVVARYQATAP